MKKNVLIAVRLRFSHALLTFMLLCSILMGLSAPLAAQCPISANPSNFSGGIVNLNVGGGNFNGDIWQIISSGDDIWYDFVTSPFNKNTNLRVYGNGSITIGYFSDTGNATPDCEITFTINNGICNDAPITTPCTNCSPTCAECPPPVIADNPPIDPNIDCNDLEIALILDESGSMGGFEADVKDGVLTFLQALSCTGARVVFYEFDQASRPVEGTYRLIDNNLIEDIEDYFDQVNPDDADQYNPSGGTNWQNAFNAVISDVSNGLTLPDLTLFLTDGNPTFNDDTADFDCESGAGSADLPDIMNAMLAANDLKALGSHLFVLGLGGKLDVANMKRITGPTEYENMVTSIQEADFALEDFDALAECLAFFADELCAFESEAISSDECGNNADGEIDIVGPTGGVIYTYELFKLIEGTFVSQAPPVTTSGTTVIQGLEAGQYRIEVDLIFSDDCIRKETFFETITNFPDVVCEIDQITPPSCSEDGSASDGSINLVLTSGTAPFTFTINSVPVTPVDNGNGTFTFNGLSEGTYEIEITDVNDCNSVCTEVVLPNQIIPDCSATGGRLTCEITSLQLTATTDAPNASFSWSGPNGFTSTAQNPTVDNPGLYTVEITNDNNGCTSTCTAEVTQDIALPNCSATGGELTCTTNSITLTATTDANNVTFNWTGPNGFTSTEQNPAVSEPGSYTVVVTNEDNNCSSSCSAEVTQDIALPSCSATGGQLTCTTTAIQLTATTNVAGAIFNWTGPNGFTSTEQNPTVSEPGSYSIQITDPNNGCSSSCTAEVTQDITEPSCTVTGGQLTCTTNSVQLTAVTDAVNPIFRWTGPNGFTSNEQNPTVSEPGTYTVEITNSDNGCSSSCTAEVTQDTELPSCSTTGGQLTCTTTSIQLTVTTDATNATFNWTGPNGFVSAEQNPTVNEAGNYVVEVTSLDNGCTSSCFAVVNPVVELAVTCSATPVTCDDDEGSSDDGTATVSITSSGTGTLTYLWDDPAGQTTPTATGLAPGTYTVTVTDAVGCTAICMAEVQPATPLAISCTATAENCGDRGEGANDGTATVVVERSGAGALTYQWDDPMAQTTPTITNLAPGTYTVTVTDANDCTAVCSAVVEPAMNCLPPLECIDEYMVMLDAECRADLRVEELVDGLLEAYDGEFYVKVIYAPGDSSINEVNRCGTFTYEVYLRDPADPDPANDLFICSGEITAVDKERPVCLAPKDVHIECKDVPFSLPEVSKHSEEEKNGIVWGKQEINDPYNAAIINWLENYDVPFGLPAATDNCGATVELVSVTFNVHCKVGYIIREFQAIDECGLVSNNTCKQRITISGHHDYCIKFPKDAEAACGENLVVPKIEFFENGCDLLSLSINDERFGDSDGCYKIFRTYRVINWCQFDSDITLFDRVDTMNDLEPLVVGRDEDCDGWPGDEDVYVRFKGHMNKDGDLEGTTWIDSNCDPWDNTPAASEGCNNPLGHWEEWADYTGGFYQYTQIIKVFDDEAPEITSVGEERFPSLASPGINGDKSFCVGQVNRKVEVFEACTPDEVVVTSVVLDPDPALNIAPIVLMSQEKLTDAASDFDFSIIDENPVFTLSGRFPFGKHSFIVKIADECGGERAAVLNFEVYDAKAPAPICRGAISLNLMAMDADQDGQLDPDAGMASIWAMDFVTSEVWDCSEPITYSIERAEDIDNGAAPDPTRMSLFFDCFDRDTVPVYIYAWDAVGNHDRCEAIVIIKDLSELCPPVEEVNASVAGAIYTETNFAIPEVEVEIAGQTTKMMMTSEVGDYVSEIPSEQNYVITPNKNTDHYNGLSIFDLVTIANHILGKKLLDSPYKLIAADVNNSQSITSADLVELRNLVLRTEEKLEHNKSWRFVDASYVFPDPSNPWAEVFPELIALHNMKAGETMQGDFIGVKVGDVTEDVVVGQLIEPREIAGTFTINIEEQLLEEGKTYEIPFRADDIGNILGYQFTLNYSDWIEVVTIKPGLAPTESFGLAHQGENAITTAWFVANQSEQLAAPGENETLFTLVVAAKRNISMREVFEIDSRFTPAEAYNHSTVLMEVDLNFIQERNTAWAGLELGQNQPNPFSYSTIIPYWLPKTSTAYLTITDMTGKIITTFRQNGVKGKNQFEIDSNQLPAGVLYYTLEADGSIATKRMVVLD